MVFASPKLKIFVLRFLSKLALNRRFLLSDLGASVAPAAARPPSAGADHAGSNPEASHSIIVVSRCILLSALQTDSDVTHTHRISMPDQALRLLLQTTCLTKSTALQPKCPACPKNLLTAHYSLSKNLLTAQFSLSENPTLGNSWNSETDELISCNGCLRKKILGSFLAGPARFFF